MISKEKLTGLLDHRDTTEAVKYVESMVDRRIVVAATTLSHEFVERTVYLPERVTSHENQGGSLTPLGRAMRELTGSQQHAVRQEIIRKYNDADYPLTWRLEDIGFNENDFVLRIMNVGDAVKDGDEK